MREPKGRDDRCEKESRERQWDPLCQWVNRSTRLVNAPNITYFFQNTLFLILQFCLAPFFNFFPLSDLKYNLPQISGKIGFFRENIGLFRFFGKKSAIFPDFFFQIFFWSKSFHAAQKQIFRRKINRKSDFFCSLVSTNSGYEVCCNKLFLLSRQTVFFSNFLKS